MVRRLLSRYCKRHDLTLVLDHGLGHAGYIESAAGRRSFFVGTRFSLNPQGSAEMARDKGYCLEFLRRSGLPTPETLLISSPALVEGIRAKRPTYASALPGSREAIRFAADTGYPVFVKPNDGQEGKDVSKVGSEIELIGLLDDLFTRHDRVLVQEALTGKDLRIVVLDGEVLCAIERVPPQIVADGHQTIGALIRATERFTPDDPRVLATLAYQNLAPDDVPPKGAAVMLLPTANLSSGGTGHFVAGSLAPHLADIAIMCGPALGLRYYAVDMIVPASADDTATDATILEVNAAPGFAELHRQGPTEAGRVEAIYERLFDAICLDL
ncbi:ATP-dependent carboxylate-amine ligase [Roseibium sp.]|uniref:ATP-dependent carboxylate-amine ligase n=1 Tax=Roseibium sp. TaxID=1936156 RepID=UPI003A969631